MPGDMLEDDQADSTVLYIPTELAEDIAGDPVRLWLEEVGMTCPATRWDKHEVRLTFVTPADAVAFKLRWM